MAEQIISISIVILVAVAGFILRGYFGGYFTEKGKYLATKEDIEQITSKVESVKSTISTLTKLKTDYEQQRREWLLKFYDSSIDMLHEKLSANFGNFLLDNGQSLYNYQLEFNLKIASMLKEYQRIVIYFNHDSPLIINAQNVLNEAISASVVMKNRFPLVKKTLLKEEGAIESGSDKLLSEARRESDHANEAFWNDMQPIVANYRDALQAYLTCLNQYLKAGNDP